MNQHVKALKAQRLNVGRAQYDLLILIALKRAEDGLHKKFSFNWENVRTPSWYEARIEGNRLMIYERNIASYGVTVAEAKSLRKRLAR